MPVTVTELQRSRKQTLNPKQGSTFTREYIVSRTTNDTTAMNAVNAEASLRYGNLKKLAIDLEPAGGGLWYAAVHYGTDDGDDQTVDGTPASPAGDDPLGAEFTGDFTGATVHITQSKETVASVKRGGGTPPDYKRAIGVSKDGVAGTDKIDPKGTITVTRNYTLITLNYLKILNGLVGTYNAATFLEHAAGEMLFTGFNVRTGSDGKKTLSFHFAISRNKTDIEICTGLTVTSKRGWDYLWVAYEPAVDADTLVSQPIAAYVERIYDEGDFSLIRI